MGPIKIAVIGCCNAPGISNCIRLLRPHDTVISLSIEHLAQVEPVEQECDVVFAVANARDFALADRLARCRSVVYWPNPVFFGFHPDILYFAIEGRPVRSAMGDYNSFITASGYARGLSARATARLFNRLVYARLGFFKYDLSRAALLAAADAVGFDLREAFAGWEHHGTFMYSINHPKLCVLADLAKICLRKAGLDFDETLSVLDHVPDHLHLGGCWPVYPEIARDIGVPGSTTFAPAYHGQLDVAFLTLEAFIEKTFEIYDRDGFTRAQMAHLAGVRSITDRIAA